MVALRTEHLGIHLDAIYAFLQTELDPYIAAVNLTVTDGLSVPVVPAFNVFLGGRQPIATLNPDQPAIEVAIPDFTLTNFSVDSTDADESMRVVMRAWLQHVGDAETAVSDVYLKATRLGRAILAATVKRENQAWGNDAVVSQVRGAYRANPETDQREAWTSSVVYEFTLEDTDLF
jgi:hypothetical protein